MHFKTSTKEESDKVKKITEGWDYLKTVLQIMTKELDNVPNLNQGGAMTNSTIYIARQSKKPKAKQTTTKGVHKLW